MFVLNKHGKHLLEKRKQNIVCISHLMHGMTYEFQKFYNFASAHIHIFRFHSFISTHSVSIIKWISIISFVSRPIPVKCCKFNWALNWNESQFDRFSQFDVILFPHWMNDQIRILNSAFWTRFMRMNREQMLTVFFLLLHLHIFLWLSILEKKRTQNSTIFAKEFDYTVCFYDESKRRKTL